MKKSLSKKVKAVKAWAIYNENDMLTFSYAPGKWEHGRLSVFVSKAAAFDCPNSCDGIVEVLITPIKRGKP